MLKRKILICLFTIILTLCLGYGYCIAEEKNHFLFYPSLIGLLNNEMVSVKDFKAAISCRGCHLITFKEWDGSSHSLAFQDPLFLAMWRLLGSNETKGQMDRLCLGCHTPIGLLTGDVQGPESEQKANKISKAGVQCDLCHSVNDLNYTHARVPLPHNASLLVKPENVKWGPIDNCKSTYHESEFSPVHTRSEFCGSCHNIFLPDSYLQIAQTYNEWKASIYAEKGIECQDCHMMPVELAKEAADKLEKPKNPGRAATVGGPERETIHEHRFVGGSLILEKGARSTVHLRKTEKRLMSAARLEAEFLSSASSVQAEAVLRVTLYNERAGHNLPTGMPGIRQLWLEVIVTDKSNKEIFHSGGLDTEGRIKEEGTVRIGAQAVDKSGQPTYYPWAIAAIRSNNAIPAKGKGVYEFDLNLPDELVWPVTAKVILHYRAFPPSLLSQLLPDSVLDIPVFDMAVKSIHVSDL